MRALVPVLRTHSLQDNQLVWHFPPNDQEPLRHSGIFDTLQKSILTPKI